MICEKNSENPAQSIVKKSRIPLSACGVFTNCSAVFPGFFQRFFRREMENSAVVL